MLNFDGWRQEFLKNRGLIRPSGRMLFSYRTTKAEYLELRELFARQLAALAGAPWVILTSAECACLVLYAAEWWRREYDGGPWRWMRILQSFGQPFSLDVIERSAAVERGLRAWGHRHSGQGKKYLGAIVAQGGLPLQMIAKGDGSMAHLLIRAMRQAQRYGWDADRLVGFFEAHQMELVHHLRDDDIYRLLASVVVTVMELRHECKLAGQAHPVELLDRALPGWRERFPISVDDGAAEPLLIGLVKEAARADDSVNSSPMVVTRYLRGGESGLAYELVLTAEMPRSIDVDALARAVGLTPDDVPQVFALDLLGSGRQGVAEGRRLLGGDNPKALLNGRVRTLVGEAAQAEQLLVLRCRGEDLNPPAEVPGAFALDDAEPWVFAVRDPDVVLVGVGGCRLAEEHCLVAATEDYAVVSDGDGSRVEPRGWLRSVAPPRHVYALHGTARIEGPEGTFTVRTAQTSELSNTLLWKGRRLPYSAGSMPVYQGIPTLCKVGDDGALISVPERMIVWTPTGGKADLGGALRQHRGPVDAWWTAEGQRQRRFKMVLLGPDARVCFRSGATDREGAIEFQGWGQVTVDAPKEFQPCLRIGPDKVTLELEAQGRPPAMVPLEVSWPGASRTLRLHVPFPVTGGRFVTVDGQNLAPSVPVSWRQLQQVRVQVIDRNPDAPKRWKLAVSLTGRAGSSHAARLQQDHAIAIDPRSGYGELPLFEMEANLLGLYSQSNQLDARLELRLTAGGASMAVLNVTRYDADLEVQALSQTALLPQEALASLSAEEVAQVKLRALPLLSHTLPAVDLVQDDSAGTPTGRWRTTALDMSQGPWLIFPGPDSRLQLRPGLWAPQANKAANAGEPSRCALATAMAFMDPKARSGTIDDVVAQMAADLDHPSWALVTHQYPSIQHLPLSSLDYWRAFARSSPGALAVLLKLPHDTSALVRRMRDELGVLWELMPRATLSAGWRSLLASMARLLQREVTDEVVRSVCERIFRGIGQTTPLLGELIELVLFEAGFAPTEVFVNLAGPVQAGARSVVHDLWLSESSQLQRYLLRPHMETDLSWPTSFLWKGQIELLQAKAPDAAALLYKLCGKDLLWMREGDHKIGVVNSPVLASLASQLIPPEAARFDWEQQIELRQIRNFDPTWFEQGCRAGLLLALCAEEGLRTAQKSAALAHRPAQATDVVKPPSTEKSPARDAPRAFRVHRASNSK